MEYKKLFSKCAKKLTKIFCAIFGTSFFLFVNETRVKRAKIIIKKTTKLFLKHFSRIFFSYQTAKFLCTNEDEEDLIEDIFFIFYTDKTFQREKRKIFFLTTESFPVSNFR